MSYFNRFPVVLGYKFGDRAVDTIDLTRRTALSRLNKNDAFIYFDYTIKDGDTPIILADRIYDDGDLFWLIMYFNDIYDIEDQWPLTSVSLDRFIARVYDNPQGVHHYESAYHGFTVDSDWEESDRVTITNYEYEFRRNEAKRKIKILLPELIGEIISEHNRLVQL